MGALPLEKNQVVPGSISREQIDDENETREEVAPNRKHH